ncbi:MAG: hypothetical protein U1E08_02630 [Coriobacteriia bacterium]|nr:hypothetical protein [Actinomycetota bacterium]MDZ4166576.1 hypothetical protein [Coriobacteriia bacterium]
MVIIRKTAASIIVLCLGLVFGCASAELPGYTSLLADEATSTPGFAESGSVEPTDSAVLVVRAEKKPTPVAVVPPAGAASAAKTTAKTTGASPVSSSSDSPPQTYPYGRCTASASPASPSIGGSVTLSVKVINPAGAPLPGVAVVFISSYMPYPGEGGFPAPQPKGYASATTNASGVASVSVRATPYNCKTGVQVQVNAKAGHNLALTSYTAQ